jgi:hypothetical protein
VNESSIEKLFKFCNNQKLILQILTRPARRTFDDPIKQLTVSKDDILQGCKVIFFYEFDDSLEKTAQDTLKTLESILDNHKKHDD